MSLNAYYTYSGTGNWSLDATSGSTTDGGDIQAIVPEGSEVEAAFLHASSYSAPGEDPTVTLASGENAVTVANDDGDGVTTANEFISRGETEGASNLEAFRANVTGFVDGVIGDGGVDPFIFNVSNMARNIDGYALEVVYSNPAEAERTIVLFDGASDPDGDNFSLNLDSPLTVDDNFEALMSLGIGFGFQSGGETFDQQSDVDVNGSRLTSSAGGFDDGAASNGGLITIGGIGDDPANPADPNALPSGDTQEEIQRSDDELYDLSQDGFLVTGDRSILVETLNPSSDDNIFFAGFNLTAEASIVSEGNDAPVARDDGGDMTPGYTTDRTTEILTPTVLANDFDPDFDIISVTGFEGTVPANVGDVVTLASGAEVELFNDGSFFYDPNGAFDSLPDGEDATDSFTYTVSDGTLTDTATVTVDVKDDEPGPVVLSLRDGSVLEGDSGTTSLEFEVNRFGNTEVDVNFELEMSPNTADSSDMFGTFPILASGTIAAGDTSTMVSVDVQGDTTPEFDEIFDARFFSATTSDPNVTITQADPTATGTIIDDDIDRAPPPPPVEADIFGDPHLTTLDGLGYDFQAVGEFTLLESTAGDPMNVQVRTEPINDAVSVITVMSMELDGSRIQIDGEADTPLTIDGTPTEIDTLDGPVDVGNGQIFYDSEMNGFTIVTESGEQIKVGLFEGYMNVCAFLNEDRPAGSVQGLLGNADGDRTNDLALRDGTVLPQPVDFDTLYGDYADSWRITEDMALFDRADGETTADFQDDSYPRVVLTLDDLPPQVVANATSIVDAAGIEDPILRDAAILDVALTSDPSFADSATTLAADPEEDTQTENNPALGPTIGISASSVALDEGDSGETTALFEVYRIGDTSAALDAVVSFGGTVDGDDVSSSLDPVTVSFAENETSKDVSVVVTGDTDVEPDEMIIANLDVDAAIRDTISIVASSARTTVTNDDETVALDITGDDTDEVIDGGPANDTLRGAGGNDTLNGQDGDDRLEGNEDDDVLNGGDGDDALLGGTGNDEINGDAGNDNISSSDGNDTANGGEGNDRMGGGLGDDVMNGDGGNDFMGGGQ
ncbi:MAG: Ig-like domain-containing protein, partial [Roseovarius sp.]|nr:Ig-like domain-containing protein [Roseovarius sp.]